MTQPNAAAVKSRVTAPYQIPDYEKGMTLPDEITVLYSRLSRDDREKEKQDDSNSIQNQKKILGKYAMENNLPSPVFFTDDGISGTTFFLAYDHYPAPEKIFTEKSKIVKGRYAGTDDAGVSGQTYHCGGLYNPVTRIAVWNNHIELTLPGGEKHVIPGQGHCYVCQREDVLGWLKDAGFVVEEEFGGCDRRPFAGKTGWDILWARKL